MTTPLSLADARTLLRALDTQYGPDAFRTLALAALEQDAQAFLLQEPDPVLKVEQALAFDFGEYTAEWLAEFRFPDDMYAEVGKQFGWQDDAL